MGEVDVGTVEPVRRRVAYVSGRWRVTYLYSREAGHEPEVRRGVIVGPLVLDRSTALWVAVVPDGCTQRTMIRRDSITDIAPPRHVR